MKHALDRLQGLRQKAVQLKHVVDAAPARAAQLRELVNATAGQLQQLRAEVDATVHGLRADSEAQTAAALVEIDGSLGTFARAGCDLTGVDLEPGPPSRLIVRLEKIESVGVGALRMLLAENEGRKLTHAILAALIRAEEKEGWIRLGDLEFREITVHVGPQPIVRLGWRRHPGSEGQHPGAVPASATAVIPPPIPAAVVESVFDRPKPAAAVTPATVPVPKPTSPRPAPTPAWSAYGSTTEAAGQPEAPAESKSASKAGGAPHQDALARFKKMPDLSKPSR